MTSNVHELHAQFMYLLKEWTAQGAEAPAAFAFLTFVSELEHECSTLRAKVEAQGEAIVTLSDRLKKLEDKQ